MLKPVTRNDPRPLYKQVKSAILAALETGEIPANAKLASERELVEVLGVSRITIRQAMKELVGEGRLLSQPGKGFYATGRAPRGYELELLRSFTDTAIAHGKVPGTRLLAVAEEPASDDIAARLEIAPRTMVVSLRRVRLLDRQPVEISLDWIAVEKVPGLRGLPWAHGNLSLYAELRNRYGLRPHHGLTLLSASLATAEEARILNLKRPAAVLSVEQIAYDAENVPINLTYATHHPHAYPLRLEQGIA